MAICLQPACRSTVQVSFSIGLAAGELREEHLAEELVIPVPRAVAIERHQETVLPFQHLEYLARAGCAEDSVTQRPREAVKYGRAI
jgi:hypothetical protein